MLLHLPHPAGKHLASMSLESQSLWACRKAEGSMYESIGIYGLQLEITRSNDAIERLVA